MGGNVADGRKLNFLMLLEGRLVDIDMLIKLCSLFEVDAFELLEKVGSLDRILNGIIMLNEVVLVERLGMIQDIGSLHKIFYYQDRDDSYATITKIKTNNRGGSF
jgi:hypothetical protein